MSDSAPQIVVIEDDDSFRVALVDLLGSLGLGAVGFTSAEAFLAHHFGKCDCVISDVHLPGISGFELGRQLESGDQTLPVILMTAVHELDLDAKAAAVRALCMLRKPFEVEALIQCPKKALIGWSPESV